MEPKRIELFHQLCKSQSPALEHVVPKLMGAVRFELTLRNHVNRNQLCIHAVNKTNPCTPIYASRWDRTTGVNS